MSTILTTAYKKTFNVLAPMLRLWLFIRTFKGKEDKSRLDERYGIASKTRPSGRLIWFHAASVGETASAFILINEILNKNNNLNVLITTGTTTSANLFEKTNNSNKVFHQYVPLDSPKWVDRFLNHWRPNAAIWMESELWPNIVLALKDRKTPLLLANARMSQKSFTAWQKIPSTAKEILSAFNLVLAQSKPEEDRYKNLGAKNVICTGNLKYCANPLDADTVDLRIFKAAINSRPVWLFASTHANEEKLAVKVHKTVSARFPDLLTIIAPRHPIRRAEIAKTIKKFHGISAQFRGEEKTPPKEDCAIYVADTIGELGLLYKCTDIACIGRSLSCDGGGGHNPIEAAALNCAIIHGSKVQNLSEIYKSFDEANAAQQVVDERELSCAVLKFLQNPCALKQAQEKAFHFVSSKRGDILNNTKCHIEEIIRCL